MCSEGDGGSRGEGGRGLAGARGTQQVLRGPGDIGEGVAGGTTGSHITVEGIDRESSEEAGEGKGRREEVSATAGQPLPLYQPYPWQLLRWGAAGSSQDPEAELSCLLG